MTKTRPFIHAQSLLRSRRAGANFSSYLDCQHQAIHATRHWWGHAFFIRLYMYFNEWGRWGVLHRHWRTAFTTPPHSPRSTQPPSVNPLQGLPTSVSRSILGYQSRPNLCIFFRSIIKRRLPRGARDQSANQRTRLNPNSDSRFCRWQTKQPKLTEMRSDGKMDTPPAGRRSPCQCLCVIWN